MLFPSRHARGAAAEDFDVKTVGDPQVSPTLLEKLATDFALQLDPAELDDLLLGGTGTPTPEPASPTGPGGKSATQVEAADAGWPIADVLERLERRPTARSPGSRSASGS